MGKQANKPHTKNQQCLKIDGGGKWEKIEMKKLIKRSEKLQTIQEKDTKEENETEEMENENEKENVSIQNETSEVQDEEREEEARDIKILVTKRYQIEDEDHDQDTIIAALRNTQAIVEY